MERKGQLGLMGRLKEKSRKELLALLEHLLQRQPDIEPLVELLMELPLVNPEEKKRAGSGRDRTLDPSTVHRLVASAFSDAGEGWRAANRIAAELHRICAIASRFADADQWANAQIVYLTVVEEILHRYAGLSDDGAISDIMMTCALGLAKCLDAQSSRREDTPQDLEEREELLVTLFDLWKSGHNYESVGTDLPAVIARHVTEDERTMVEGWLRQEMRPGQDFSSQWHNRRIIDFLVTLKQAGRFSDEELLEEYRRAGLYKELTEHLLQLGRTNEALDVAQANVTEPMDVTWFAEQLLRSGQGWQEQAMGLVEMRLKEAEHALQGKPQDFITGRTVDTYRRWLSEKYLLHGKAKQALDMELARFQASSDETTYRSVRSAAQVAGQPEATWSGLRPRLLRTLEQRHRWEALVSIYLNEGAVDQALAALDEMERTPQAAPYGYGYRAEGTLSHSLVQVAQAAEEPYPDEALRLYKRLVQTLIDGRGRENYRQATGYLSRIRQLSQKQGREAEWHAYMTNLRNSNKSLRAFKEELEQRDL